MRKFPLVMLVISLSLFLFGCLDFGPGTQNVTAQFGDNVTVDYTLRVDGKVLDTSMGDVAKSAGIYNENRTYQPLTMPVLLGGKMIDGFIKGIIGMKVNETKNITVTPEDGYGASDPSKISNTSRYYNMSVYEEVPMSFFTSQNITPKIDKVFPTKYGFVAVSNFTNETVIIQYVFSPGHKFVIDGLPESVVNMTNETMLIRVDVVENGTYVISDQMGKKKAAWVSFADNDTVVFNENHPLAGKQLEFEITVRSIISSNPNSKT